jgi:hypothetical protein
MSGESSLRQGTITENKIVVKLLKLGYSVSEPVGDNERYDLIADLSNELLKVQCKTAFKPKSTVEGSVRVELRNQNYGPDGEVNRKEYSENEIDVYAIRNPYSSEIYWIPFDEAPKSQMSINMNPKSQIDPRNKERANISEELLIENRLSHQVD